MNKNRLLSLLTVAVCAPAMAAQYTIVDLGPAPAGVQVAINDSPAVTFLNASLQAVVWKGGTFTPIESPLGVATPKFIDNKGTVSGNICENTAYPCTRQTVFYWINGEVSVIPRPAGNIAVLADSGGAGWSDTGTSFVHATLFSARTLPQTRDLTPTLQGNSTATGINSRGWIIGKIVDQGALWKLNTTANEITQIPLGTLGGARSVPHAINNVVDTPSVVGHSNISTGGIHAFLWKDGVMQDLGTLGGKSSTARDVSFSNDVVGESTTAAGKTHAFLWRNGQMKDLGALAGNQSLATHQGGDVIGSSLDAAGAEHAVVWRGSNFKLVDLGKGAKATGINARGDVAGSRIVNGSTRATLWIKTY